MGNSCIISWTRLIRSQVVSLKACLYYGIILKESGGSEKYANVYDGDGTGGNHFHKYTCPAQQSKPFNLPAPVKFERGLYVEFESGLDEVTVLWQPLKG